MEPAALKGLSALRWAAWARLASVLGLRYHDLERPWLAILLVAVLSVGLALGAGPGIGAGLLLGLARLGATLVNGVSHFNGGQTMSLVNSALFYMVAGAVAGYVAGLLRGAERRVLPDQVEALSRAVSEALTNAGKHAQARRLTVFVEPADGGGLFCSVKDDGTGFEAAATALGVGIDRSIVGRMAEIGGRAEVRSRPGHGTEVCLWL